MSNHMIGHVYDEMNEEILKLYDEGEVSKEICKKIMKLGIEMVNRSDGNFYEATESMQGVRCGGCLEPYNGRKVYSIFDKPIWEILENDFPEAKEISNNIYEYFLSGELCENCFRKILTDHLNDEKAEEVLNAIDNFDVNNTPLF